MDFIIKSHPYRFIVLSFASIHEVEPRFLRFAIWFIYIFYILLFCVTYKWTGNIVAVAAAQKYWKLLHWKRNPVLTLNEKKKKIQLELLIFHRTAILIWPDWKFDLGFFMRRTQLDFRIIRKMSRNSARP